MKGRKKESVLMLAPEPPNVIYTFQQDELKLDYILLKVSV